MPVVARFLGSIALILVMHFPNLVRSQCDPTLVRLEPAQESLSRSLLLNADGESPILYLTLFSEKGGKFHLKAGGFERVGDEAYVSGSQLKLPAAAMGLAAGDLKEIAIPVEWKTSGIYRGNLLLHAKEDSCTTVIPLELRLMTEGQLALVEPNSQLEVRYVSPSWLNGLVPPRIRQNAISLRVENKGGTDVALERISFSLQGQETNTNLDETHLAKGELPIIIPPFSYQTLNFPFSSQQIPPDEYRGNLRLHVDGEQSHITMPITLYGRSGVWGAIFVLLLGILVGRMMKDVDKAKDQMKAMDVFIPLQGRVAQLTDPKTRSILERELSGLNKAINLAKSEEEWQAIQEQMEAMETKLGQIDAVAEVWAEMEPELPTGSGAEKAAYKQVSRANQAILNGDEARFQASLAELTKQLKISNGSRDATAEPMPSFDDELAQLRREVKLGKPAPQPPAEPTLGQRFNQLLFFLSGIKVNARVRYALFRPLASLATFLIILLLGFQEIYLNAGDTFGVDGFYDFLKLFLWGIVSDVFTRSLTGNTAVSNFLSSKTTGDSSSGSEEEKKI